MVRRLRWWVIGLLAIPCLGITGTAMFSHFTAAPPPPLDGQLPACPDSPNCVSSQAQRDDQQVAPLEFSGPPHEAWQRLQEVIGQMPRARVQTQSDHYLHVTCRSRVLRFVDDLQFLLVPDQHIIHVRSASRVGHSDLGANRRRVETIRREFQ